VLQEIMLKNLAERVGEQIKAARRNIKEASLAGNNFVLNELEISLNFAQMAANDEAAGRKTKARKHRRIAQEELDNVRKHVSQTNLTTEQNCRLLEGINLLERLLEE
jgi:hypothetical protein